MTYVVVGALLALAIWFASRPALAAKHMHHMLQDLQLFSWYTLADLVRAGFPQWACEKLLPDFYVTGMMQVRFRKDPLAQVPEWFTARDIRSNLGELEYCLVRRRPTQD